MPPQGELSPSRHADSSERRKRLRNGFKQVIQEREHSWYSAGWELALMRHT
jgi:hypothetical protein